MLYQGADFLGDWLDVGGELEEEEGFGALSRDNHKSLFLTKVSLQDRQNYNSTSLLFLASTKRKKKGFKNPFRILMDVGKKNILGILFWFGQKSTCFFLVINK